VGEIAEMFNVKLNIVVNNLWESVRNGEIIAADPLLAESTLTSDEQARVLKAFEELGADRLRPVCDALQEAIPYEELHLLRLYFVMRTIKH
jgi:ATP-dependent DNA helicase RecQ